MQTLQEVRDLVDLELMTLAGSYNPEDAKNNTRIINDIRKSVKDLGNGIYPTPQHIAEVAIAANENVQMRDFLIGLRVEKQPIAENSFNYLYYIGNVIKKEICVPIATVFSTYIYEIGEKDVAKKTLVDILEVKPGYSLALLLQRFFDADAPTEVMTEMALQLHEKVLANIYEEGDKD